MSLRSGLKSNVDKARNWAIALALKRDEEIPDSNPEGASDWNYAPTHVA